MSRGRHTPPGTRPGARPAALVALAAGILVAGVLGAAPARAEDTVCTVNGEPQLASEENDFTISGVDGQDNTIDCDCSVAEGVTIVTGEGGATTLTITGTLAGTVLANGAQDTIAVQPLIGEAIAPTGLLEVASDSAEVTVAAGDPGTSGPAPDGNAGTILLRDGTVSLTVTGGDAKDEGQDGGTGNSGTIDAGSADADIDITGGSSQGGSGGAGNTGSVTGGASGPLTVAGGDGQAGGSSGNTGTITVTSASPTTLTVTGGSALGTSAPAPPAANTGTLQGGPAGDEITVSGGDNAGERGGDGNGSGGRIAGGDGADTIDVSGGDGSVVGGTANAADATIAGEGGDDTIILTAGSPVVDNQSNAGTVDGGSGTNTCQFTPAAYTGTVINCGITCPPEESRRAEARGA